MNKLTQKLFNFMIGEELSHKDEFQQKELYKIFAEVFVLIYWLMLILLIVMVIWDIYHQGQLSLITMGLGLIFTIINGVVMKKTSKYQLLIHEFYSLAEYQQALKKLKNRAIFAGVFFGFMMTLSFLFSNTIMQEHMIVKSLLRFVIPGVVSGSLYGFFMYKFAKTRLTLIKEE